MSASPSPPVPEKPRRLPLEDRLAGPMFVLSILFLLVLGGLLHRQKLPAPEDVATAAHFVTEEGVEYNPFNTELLIQLGILAALLPFFWLEGLVRFCVAVPYVGWLGPLKDLLVVIVLPPLRMGQRSRGPGRELWLPWLGWRPVNRDLQKQLERNFGLPMIFIALLVLPLLAIEYFFTAAMRDNFWFLFFVELGNALIWFAFTVEFIVMQAVAKVKLYFCLEHWIDLAIIVLPIFSFLPIMRVLRLGRVIRLEQLARLGRLYRMQGVALRAWRAFLVLELLNRLLGLTPETQLERLREMAETKEEELAELRHEIEQLEAEIRQKQAEKEAEKQEEQPVAG
jgi:voltage-gated potassium channel